MFRKLGKLLINLDMIKLFSFSLKVSQTVRIMGNISDSLGLPSPASCQLSEIPLMLLVRE